MRLIDQVWKEKVAFLIKIPWKATCTYCANVYGVKKKSEIKVGKSAYVWTLGACWEAMS